MNQEMVKAEKRFANHKARLDILDENVRVLNWRQPGTQAYAIRAVMDGYHVYITGDLGSAVICLTETATLKALSGYWKKPGYFMEKFVCTTDDYFFDYETAKGELRERKTMLLEAYRDNHPDMLANGETEYQDDLDERETDLLGSFNSKKGFAANPDAFSAWLEMDGTAWRPSRIWDEPSHTAFGCGWPRSRWPMRRFKTPPPSVTRRSTWTPLSGILHPATAHPSAETPSSGPDAQKS